MRSNRQSRPPPNRRLYGVLELEPGATEEEIKRAYKKLAVKYHPDKNPGNEDKFKELASAYSILSDPQKRQVYDQYGEQGMMAFENGYFGEDGELLSVLQLIQSPLFRCFMCCLLFLTVCLTVLVPIFVTIKLDGAVGWNWGVVFIPLWILNVVPGIVSCFMLSKGKKALLTIVQFFCLLSFQIALAVQLQKGSLSWPGVFVPIYIWQAISILKTLINSRSEKFMAAQNAGQEGLLFGCGRLGYALRRLVVPLLHVVFIILLVLKVNGDGRWSWWINAIPLFIAQAWSVGTRVLNSFLWCHNATDPEVKAQKRSFLCMESCVLLLTHGLVLTFIILCVLKLDGAGFSVASAFVPLWIVLGVLFLCGGCCAPIAICCCAPQGLGEGDFDEEAGQNDDGSPPYLVRQKYIEGKKEATTNDVIILDAGLPNESSPLAQNRIS